MSLLTHALTWVTLCQWEAPQVSNSGFLHEQKSAKQASCLGMDELLYSYK